MRCRVIKALGFKLISRFKRDLRMNVEAEMAPKIFYSTGPNPGRNPITHKANWVQRLRAVLYVILANIIKL